jgi:hypothetical protein
MNTQMNVTPKVRVDQRLLDEIKTRVEETIAFDVNLAKKRSERVFCAAELWNIHKQKQSLRRRF